MVDTRFHRFAGPQTLSALLALVDQSDLAAHLGHPDLTITGVAELELAGPGELALAAQPSYIEELRATAASAVLVAPALKNAVPEGCIAVVIDKPHNIFADTHVFI